MTRRTAVDIRLLTVITACVFCLSATGTRAQSSRDVAQLGFKQANVSADSGQLQLAAAQYEEVLDLDDPDSEFPDIRGAAGLGLGLTELKLGNREKAIAAFKRVLKIKGCPDRITKAIHDALEKLGES